MSSLANPAGRLHQLLSDAKRKPHSKSCLDVWSEVLGIQDAPQGIKLTSVIKIVELVSVAKNQVIANGGTDHALFMKPFVKIESAFLTVAPSVSWKNFSDQLDDATMLGILYCADFLARSSSVDDLLDKSKLDAIRNRVELLLEEIQGSDLEKPLKDVLLRSLGAILKAILEYRITGREGLELALAQGFGAPFANAEVFAKNYEEPRVRSWWDILNDTGLVLNLAVATKELAPPIINGMMQLMSGG